MFTPEQNQQIKALQIVAAALILGVLFFTCVAVLVNSMGESDISPEFFIPLLIISLALLSNIPVGYIIFNKRIASIKNAPGFTEKMAIFRSAFIIRAALFEMLSFFAIVSYLLTSRYELLAIAFIGLAAMLITFPTKSRIENTIENTYEV